MIIWLDVDFKELCFTLEKNDWKKGKEFLDELKNTIPDEDWITEVYYQTYYKTEMLWRIYVRSFPVFKKIFEKKYPAEYKTQRVNIKLNGFRDILTRRERKKTNDAHNCNRTVGERSVPSTTNTGTIPHGTGIN